MNAPLNRRDWLATSAFGLGYSLLQRPSAPAADSLREPTAEQLDAAKRELVRKWLHTTDDIGDWLTGKAYPFCKYDEELGYLHINRKFKEGLNGSYCVYTYDANDARHTAACADRPCRINTYGNSFTSCEQVSDHETWQEVLAAHLGEPIRNFGIGGYSVYQAYLRMRREEAKLPAKYIIINIFDDDHSRNLYACQRAKFGVNRKSPCPPIPHVKVDPDKGLFVEEPNPCSTPKGLYVALCSFDEAWKTFADDPGLTHRARYNLLHAQGGPSVPHSDFDDADWMRRGLYATTRIVELIEQFAAEGKRKVLYVLSYSSERVRRFVMEGKRFDTSLIEFLDRRGLPYVDLLKAHAAEAGKPGPELEKYLSRHFIGHYSPLGNFFCAFAMKNKLVSMLDPPPPSYGGS